MTAVIDTNTLIYHLGDRLARPLLDDDYVVSVITKIELLSYPSLSREEEQRITAFLETITVAALTNEVRDAAIRLRRAHRLRIPDAIIAGTALALGAELLMNDVRLARVPGIRSRQLPLKET